MCILKWNSWWIWALYSKIHSISTIQYECKLCDLCIHKKIVQFGAPFTFMIIIILYTIPIARSETNKLIEYSPVEMIPRQKSRINIHPSFLRNITRVFRNNMTDYGIRVIIICGRSKMNDTVIGQKDRTKITAISCHCLKSISFIRLMHFVAKMKQLFYV